MRFQTLPEWLCWLEKLHPVDIELGLERVASVAALLEVLPRNATVVTVAGTNGKGSTLAALSALIRANHVKNKAKASPAIGMYTSPHLCSFNERIAINGKPCADQLLIEAFAQVDAAMQAVSQTHNSPFSLTYFEFTTLAALLIFRAHNLDYWLLEVGLGGRLDAVNIIDADIAVITSIALDHQAWLGDSREKIAIEKAAIARSDKPVIIGDSAPPVTLSASLGEIGARPVYQALSTDSPFGAASGQHGFTRQQSALSWQGTRINGAMMGCDDLPEPMLPLASWSCALQASLLLFDCLPTRSELRSLFSETRLNGRGSLHEHRHRAFMLDVAHNPQAIEHLGERLAREAPGQRYLCIFALLDDKPLTAIVGQLSSVVRQWVVPTLQDCPRAFHVTEIEKAIQQQANQQAKTKECENTCTNITASVAEAIDWAVHHTSVDDRIIVCGSFYLVGEALALLEPRV